MWQCENASKANCRRLLVVIQNNPMPTAYHKQKQAMQWWEVGGHGTVQVTDQQNNLKLTLKKLIVNCSNLIRRYEDRATTAANSRREIKRLKKQVKAQQPFILLENICKRRVQSVPQPPAPTKDEFLNYFALNPTKDPAMLLAGEQQRMPNSKLSQCTNIPFSSDVGRIMVERENHRVTEEVKLKRLERSEWYVNKTGHGTSVKSEESNGGIVDEDRDKLKDAHVFKPPKRQNHQRNPTMHDPDFLMQFCNPVTVRVERYDCVSHRQPVVLIRKSERILCDSVKKRKLPSS